MARKRLRFLLFAQLSCSGCFSSTPFQSARVTEPGESNGPLSVQRTRPRDGSHDGGWIAAEFGTRVPIGKGADLGLNGTILSFDPARGYDGPRVGGLMLGVGFKGELIDDVLSSEVPVKWTFAGQATLHTTQFYPRAILSLPVNDFLEVNLSATKFFFPAGSGEMPWGYSVGLAIGKRGGAIFRPEVGVLDYPYGNDMIQFGIAYTPEFRTPKSMDKSMETSKSMGPSTERTPY
jgi:hypothetical protein